VKIDRPQIGIQERMGKDRRDRQASCGASLHIGMVLVIMTLTKEFQDPLPSSRGQF
jgi:hypothetical protein